MFRLSITKDYLDFAAAHFITYKGNCERLHGHNYQVQVEVVGELSSDGYVFDFVELKQIIADECAHLDHRVLLQTENPQILVTQRGESIEARYQERFYCFPAADVVLLPITNTTAELLAHYLAERIVVQLQQRVTTKIAAVGVWVSESVGQRAYAEVALKV